MGLRIHTLWSAFGNVSSRILQFAGTLVLARLLFPEDFGLIASVQAVTGLLGLAASNGWGQALIRQKDLDDETCHSVFSFQLLYFTAAFFLLLFSADLLSIFFRDQRYGVFLSLAALILFARAFQTVPRALLQRRMAFKSVAIVNTISASAPLVVSIPMALLNYGAWSLIFGQLASAITASVGYILYSGYRPRLSFSLSRFLKVFGLSYRFVIIAALEHVSMWAPIAIVSRKLGFTAGGFLQRSTGTAQLPTELFSQSLSPPLFRAMTKFNQSERIVYLNRTIGVTILYLWPVAYVLAFFSNEIILLLYGRKWTEAAPLLSLLSGYLVLFALYSPSRIVLSALSDLRFLTSMRLVSTSLLVLSIWFTSDFGLISVGTTILSVFFVETIATCIAATKLLGANMLDILKTTIPSTAGMLMGGLVASLFIKGSSFMDVVLHLTIFFSIYALITIFLFRSNPEAEFLRRKIIGISNALGK